MARRLTGPERVLAASSEQVEVRHGHSLAMLAGAVGFFLFPTLLIVFWEPLFGDMGEVYGRRARQGLTFLPIIVPTLYLMAGWSLVQFLRRTAYFHDTATGERLRPIWEGARYADEAGAEQLHWGLLYGEPRYYTGNVHTTGRGVRTHLTLWEVPGRRTAFAAVAYGKGRSPSRLFPLVTFEGARFDVLEHQRSLFRDVAFMVHGPTTEESAAQWDMLERGGQALGPRPPERA